MLCNHYNRRRAGNAPENSFRFLLLPYTCANVTGTDTHWKCFQVECHSKAFRCKWQAINICNVTDWGLLRYGVEMWAYWGRLNFQYKGLLCKHQLYSPSMLLSASCGWNIAWRIQRKLFKENLKFMFPMFRKSSKALRQVVKYTSKTGFGKSEREGSNLVAIQVKSWIFWG